MLDEAPHAEKTDMSTCQIASYLERRLMRTSFDVRNADATTLSNPGLRPVTIVSADSHVCLPPKMYKEYLDPQFHGSWDDYLADVAIINKVVDLQGYPAPPENLEVFDKRGV